MGRLLPHLHMKLALATWPALSRWGEEISGYTSLVSASHPCSRRSFPVPGTLSKALLPGQPTLPRSRGFASNRKHPTAPTREPAPLSCLGPEGLQASTTLQLPRCRALSDPTRWLQGSVRAPPSTSPAPKGRGRRCSFQFRDSSRSWVTITGSSFLTAKRQGGGVTLHPLAQVHRAESQREAGRVRKHRQERV